MPEVIRLSLLETARLSDEKLLKRTHGDISHLSRGHQMHGWAGIPLFCVRRLH